MRCFVSAVACLLLLLPAAAPAEDLAEVVQPLIDAHRGDVAVKIKDLATGETFEYHADKTMPTASLIKFPLMIASFQEFAEGNVTPDAIVELDEKDKVPGSGVLTAHFSGGAKMPLRDAIRLMIVYSDNTATNLVAKKVGLDKTAKLMEKLGYPETKLHSYTFNRPSSLFPERSVKYGLGSTTPADMVSLLEKLWKKELVSEEASEKMLTNLYACADKSTFPRYLPDVKFAHKTGATELVRTDAGLMELPSGGPIAMCVMTNENEDQSWSPNNEGDVLCSKIAQAVYRYYTEGSKSDSNMLKKGSAGPLVASLQRTLNEQLKPSPELDADGDFGAMTETAVTAFQKAKNLKPTGVVGPETWEALGPLVEEGPKAPAPAVANAEVFKKADAEALDGPPIVGCRVWAIADGKTGEVLWGFNEEKPVDIASTTKMMTAYLVGKLAEKHPEVLKEKLTFSKRADETIGSTSDLRAGEVVTVEELLYGLMLPSGNDASVAFAEHFGSRAAPGGDGKAGKKESAKEAYDEFIEAMNAAAKELGMEHSHFTNTHGLTDKEHKASAADLAKLALAVKQIPILQKVVATPQHGATVTGPGGYERNVLWKNTNNLLKIEGYDGVKTGTTDAAGACLVSSAKRGDDSLIVVVLGAPSSDSRYVDSRNLYRWGWSQLEKQKSEGK
ncbi:serine hydrolase [Lacipirellula sp.]|uniref:serine hydrolase n=1 Tax=Lacipirellula sp. TaxID=2691419 RepID=UPI003D0DFD14